MVHMVNIGSKKEGEKPIWIGSTLHKKIKLEAAKKEMTMRQFIAIILKNYLEGEKYEKQTTIKN